MSILMSRTAFRRCYTCHNNQTGLTIMVHKFLVIMRSVHLNRNSRCSTIYHVVADCIRGSVDFTSSAGPVQSSVCFTTRFYYYSLSCQRNLDEDAFTNTRPLCSVNNLFHSSSHFGIIIDLFIPRSAISFFQMNSRACTMRAMR